MINFDDLENNLNQIQTLSDDDILTRKLLQMCSISEDVDDDFLINLPARIFIKVFDILFKKDPYKNSHLIDMTIFEFLNSSILSTNVSMDVDEIY
ncbi:hypothetical protein ACTPDI_18255 [Clostridioides difficile]